VFGETSSNLKVVIYGLFAIETYYIIFIAMTQQSLVGWSLLIIEASRSYSVRHTTLGKTPPDERSA
jgi:hypothetical protein